MNKSLIVSSLLACALNLSCFAQDRTIPMNIVYPAGAFTQNGGPVINIKNTPLFSPNAMGDGVNDDTAAFVAMMNYIKQQVQQANGGDPRKIIYIPSGTYMVSNTIFYTGADYNLFGYLRIVGQNRANTVIKLADRSPGFGAGTRKPVLSWTKLIEIGNEMWGNQLRNLTIDTGTGNPGAVGVDFLGANGCSIDNLTVRSGDGQGFAGLRFPWWSVQGHFSDITVSGFDYGIRAGDDVRETNPVLEYITLSAQRIAGIHVGRSAACLRKVKSTNTVPGVLIDGTAAHVVVLDSQFTGGSSANAALVLGNSAQSQLFARNISVSGYGASIRRDGSDALTGPVNEWLSGNVYSFNASVPKRTMNLPVEEAPLVPWESNPANWANPDDYPGSNDAQKIQAALNSGKPAIYFPRYFFVAQNTPLLVPPSVKQIDFMVSNSWIWGGFNINQASPDTLFIEHASRKVPVRINAPRTLSARFSSLMYEVNTTAPVVAHFQTGAVLANGHLSNFCPPNATIYARSINEESRTQTNFLVNGGTMWVLGYKVEADQIAFEARNGAFLEVLGGYHNFAAVPDSGKPTILNNESNVSYVGTNFMSRTHQEGIWETRNGVTSTFKNADFPRRTTGNSGNYFVPLYVGYNPALLPQTPSANTLISESFDSGSAITNTTSLGNAFLVETIVGNSWTYSSTGGVLGGGRLVAPGGQNASVVHRTDLPSFANAGSLALSIDTFVAKSSTNEPTFSINWWMFLKNPLTVGNGGLTLEMRYIPPASRTSQNPERFQILANNVLIGTPDFDTNTWYGWDASWTLLDAAARRFDLQLQLFRLSATGTQVFAGSYSLRNFVAPAVNPSAVMHAGVQGRGRPGTGVQALDSFAVSTDAPVFTAAFSENFEPGTAITNQSGLESECVVDTLAGNKWSHSASVGIGAGGGLAASGGQNSSVVHRSPAPGFNSSTGSLVVAMDTFISNRNTNEPTYGISWWTFVKNAATPGNAGLIVELRYIPPTNRTPQNPERFQIVANGVVIGAPALTSNQWFGWEIQWSIVAGATDTFNVTVDLFSLGANGLGSPVAAGSYSRQNFVQSGIANSSSLYSGMQGRARDGTGIFRIDNWKAGTK